MVIVALSRQELGLRRVKPSLEMLSKEKQQRIHRRRERRRRKRGRRKRGRTRGREKRKKE